MFVESRSEEGITHVLLNRPPANGYTIDVLAELQEAISAASNDQGTRVICLRSAVPRFFCAGADVKVFAANDTQANRAMVTTARAVLDTLLSSPKVTVAAISGHALGGGLELALGCDVRIAASGEYKLGLPEIQLGLMPGNGGTQLLPRLVGYSAALRLLVTGRSISPAEGVRIGLLDELGPESGFDGFVSDYLSAMARMPGLAVAAIKQAVRDGAPMKLPDALALERSCVDRLYDTEDAQEGFTAFLEKRSPRFRHR